MYNIRDICCINMSEFLKNMKRYARLHQLLLAIIGCIPSASGQYVMLHLLTILILDAYIFYIVLENIYVAWPDDINQIAYHVTPVLAMLLMSAKFINYLVQRDENYELMRIIQEKFWLENITSPERERAAMVQYARAVYWFNIIEFIPMYAAAPMWLLFPFVDMFIFQRNNGEPFRRMLPFNHHYIPGVYDGFSYYIMYLIQTIGVCFAVTVLIALDCLYVHFIMSTCGQFRILQIRVRHFDTDENGIKLSIDEQTMKVKKYVRLHQELLLFCAKLEDTLNFNLFVQFFAGIGFLCTSGFIITIFEGDMFIAVQNVLCMAASLSELFLQCYTANLLTTESMEVAFAAYSSNWMDAPENVKKLILIIIMRAQKPIYLTIGKFTPVSLSTFESMIRSAASYFTILMSMKEEN